MGNPIIWFGNAAKMLVSKLINISGTKETYADIKPQYFEAFTQDSSDGSYGQAFLGHGATPELGIYLSDGSVNLEASFKVLNGVPVFTMDNSLTFLGNSYNSAGTTELYYGKISHRFAGTAPSGSVKIDRQKSGDMLFINNVTTSNITFIQNTTETFNGSTTFTALPGKWYMLTQFSGLGVYGVSVLNSVDNDAIGIVLDGGGSAITAGTKGTITIPYNCTINDWTVTADVIGDIVIDVKKATYASFPTTASIAGSEKPTLVAAQKNQDLSLSTWTTTITAGDVLEFVVDSAATVTKVTLSMKVTK